MPGPFLCAATPVSTSAILTSSRARSTISAIPPAAPGCAWLRAASPMARNFSPSRMQDSQRLQQLLRAQVLLRDHRRRSILRQTPPHFSLMIVRRSRKRHQHRRLSRCCQLRHRARAAPARESGPLLPKCRGMSSRNSRTSTPRTQQIRLRSKAPRCVLHESCPALMQAASAPAALRINFSAIVRHPIIQRPRSLAAAKHQQPQRDRSSASDPAQKTHRRTGTPGHLQGERKYFPASAKCIAAACAQLPAMRFAMPGIAFGSNTSFGIRRSRAASHRRPRRISPTPTTTSASAASAAAASCLPDPLRQRPTDFSRVASGLTLFSGPEAIRRSGNPAAGTSRDSNPALRPRKCDFGAVVSRPAPAQSQARERCGRPSRRRQ